MAELDPENPFRSKTLVYRSPENNERDKSFYDLLLKDPSYTIHANGDVLRPSNREINDESFKNFMQRTLAVFICLPNPIVDSGDNGLIRDPAKPSTSPNEKEDEDAHLTPIGILSLAGGTSTRSEYDVQHRNLSLALGIAKPYRNRGIGREAINWALDWAFQFAGMRSVGLGCYEWNVRGRHLYESVGFILCGVYRKEYYFNRKWWDGLYFSMLDEEWEALRAKQRQAGCTTSSSS